MRPEVLALLPFFFFFFSMRGFKSSELTALMI